MLTRQLAIVKTAWARGLTYRFTVVMFRLSDVVELVAQLVIWMAVFGTRDVVSGYQQNEMITYVIIGYTAHVMTRNFLNQAVSDDIEKGTLSQFLVKPMQYISYIMTREVGRNGLTWTFSVITQVIFIALFWKHILLPASFAALGIILVMMALVVVINLFISFLVGCIAFWTVETMGAQVFLQALRRMFAGNFFPLNLLPVGFVTASFLLPFSYSFFVPMQLYLGKMSIQQGLIGVGVEVVWLVILYGITKFVWSRGMRAYESVGI